MENFTKTLQKKYNKIDNLLLSLEGKLLKLS